MTADLLAVHPPQRRFLPQGFEFKTWEDLKPYFEQLQNEEILDVEHLRDWFKSRSELESYLSENFAWRYIRMTCNTADQAAQQQYQQFVTEIQPHIAPYDDAFNKKAIENPAINLLSDKGFAITLRGMKRAIEIFREENIPLVTQVQQLSSQYQATVGAMTVEVNGEVVAEVVGREVIDHQLQTLAWLAATLHRFGRGLRAGDCIMTGSFTRPLPMRGPSVRYCSPCGPRSRRSAGAGGMWSGWRSAGSWGYSI